jgi:hypothetical protein
VIFLLRIVEFALSLISFAILTSAWVYIASRGAYYILKLFTQRRGCPGFITRSIFTTLVLEILLAFITMPIMSSIYAREEVLQSSFQSALKNGFNFTAALSPISSFIAAVIGIRKQNCRR